MQYIGSRIASFSLLACLSLPSWLVTGEPQGSPPIDAIHSRGQKKFTEAQIISASGLRPGQPFSVDALTKATNRLGDTGAFATVRYNYKTEAGKLNVEFVVEEAAKFHKCIFDNFVWATDAELLSQLKKTLPLYDGTAPEGGSLADDVAAASEAFLKSRNVVNIHVSRGVAGALGSPNWEHLYSVAGPSLKVTAVDFAGASTLDNKLLQKEAAALIGREFSRVEFREYGRRNFIPLYREHGYLRAAISEVTLSVSKHTEGTDLYELQAVYPVAEGQAYDWDVATWEGQSLFSADQLSGFLGMTRGQLANGKKLDEGTEAIRIEYSRRGRPDLRLVSTPSFDDTARRVTYRFSVVEGPEYHMGIVNFVGFSPQVAALLKQRWKLQPGDVFDGTYEQSFLRDDLRSALQSARAVVRGIKTSDRPDRDKHVVDIDIEAR